MGLVALIVLIACHHKKAGSIIKNFINKDSTNNLAIAAGAGGAAALALDRDRREARKDVAIHQEQTLEAISTEENRDSAGSVKAQRREAAAQANIYQKENWSIYQRIMAVLAIAFIGLAVKKAVSGHIYAESAQPITQSVFGGIGLGVAVPVIWSLLKTSFSSDDNNGQQMANNQ